MRFRPRMAETTVSLIYVKVFTGYNNEGVQEKLTRYGIAKGHPSVLWPILSISDTHLNCKVLS